MPDDEQAAQSTSSTTRRCLTGTQQHADRVATCVIEKFESLKKHGKPQGKEWTVLAGVVLRTKTSSSSRESVRKSAGDQNEGNRNTVHETQGLDERGKHDEQEDRDEDASYRCIVLATGTRCAGRQLAAEDYLNGSIVRDCHAEVLAQKGLRLWLASAPDDTVMGLLEMSGKLEER
ncbi:unnamed protein product, partial [Amoebophrya sp. A25]|eukprot:GSA25T00011133001.1